MQLSVRDRRWLGVIALQIVFACWSMCHAVAGSPIAAVAFAPGGRQVLIGSQAGIEVRSWPELHKTEKTIATELIHVHDLAFAPDGRHLLAAGGAPAEAGVVEVLSWPEAKLIRRISRHDDLVYRVAWSPSGTQWASASADGTCQVFSADTGELVTCYAGHSRAVLALVYLPDGETLASAGVDQTIHLWNSRSGAHLRTLDNHLAAVNDLAIRPTGEGPAASPPTLVSVSDDRTVRLWQPTIGRLVRFARLPSIAQAVAWTPSGDRILVGCHDGLVRMIDPDTAAIGRELSGAEERIHAIAIAPGQSRTLVIGQRKPLSLAW